ncbi:hypothetical protein FRB97_009047 [Tulasnella sp. 331]|nr:hypothetical protein FRB97_009047 [Tulasnella sp. 331]
MSAPADAVDLTKMTVPSLKLMCKNRGLSGYSKMKKEALITLLKKSITRSAGDTTAEVESSISSSAISTDQQNRPQPVPFTFAPSPTYSSSSTSTSSPATCSSSVSQTLGKRQRSPEMGLAEVPITKKPAPTPHSENSAQPSLGIKSVPSLTIASARVEEPTAFTKNNRTHTSQPSAKARISTPVRLQTHTPARGSKRIASVQPGLSSRRVHQMIALVHKPPKPIVSASVSSIPPLSSRTAEKESSLHIKARRITPPGADTDKERKRICSLAFIFSVLPLSNVDRSGYVLVNKDWRHAIFLSAQLILRSRFAGARLRQYLLNQDIDPYYLDVWPYLRERERELRDVRINYSSSFLSRFYPPYSPPLNDKLWGSPDHEDQASVALRLTISISLNVVARWTKWQVDAVAPIGNGDVHEIVIKYGQHKQKLLVLAASGEVIKQLSGSVLSDQADDSLAQIRLDWCDFITSQIHSNVSTHNPPPSLADRVHCHNEEEFEGGISKLWLRNMRADPDGFAKVTVAKRYIIANAVPNSVSGTYMTPSQMAQSLDCPDGSASDNRVGTGAKVNLYVASCNYVESVHFKDQRQSAFHLSVASIQTQAREVFLLRETGQEIGMEEEGIRPVWMDLLSCSAGGMPYVTA